MLYAIRSTVINAPFQAVFDYIANPLNLPRWTNAFSSANHSDAMLITPMGTVPIELDTNTNPQFGTIDWLMTFPDQSQGSAFSRVTALSEEHTLYSFTLTPPPVPLEQLEGALEQQTGILEQELAHLKTLLEV